MEQYKSILRDILEKGIWTESRSGISSIRLPHPAVLQHDMREGFPILTSTSAPFELAIAQMVGLIQGVTSSKDFRELDREYRNQNDDKSTQWARNLSHKTEEGREEACAAQWRRWSAYKLVKLTDKEATNRVEADGYEFLVHLFHNTHHEDGSSLYFREIDQLGDCVRAIISSPTDRSILFHACDPATLDELALPSCRFLYQFIPSPATKDLALSLTISTSDMSLGWPSNVMGAAALLHLVARLTGYEPRWLTVMSNDAHIRRDQLETIETYLACPAHDLPELAIAERVPIYIDMMADVHDTTVRCEDDRPALPEMELKKKVTQAAIYWLNNVKPSDFGLVGYQHELNLSASAAV